MNLDQPVQSTKPLFGYLIDRSLVMGNVRLLLLLLMVVCCNGIVSGQEDLGREAFSKKKYPWYNPKSDQVERIEMKERPEIRSKNRQSIPLKKIRPTHTKPANQNFANAGSFLGGLSLVAWGLIVVLIAAVAGVLFWAFLRMEPELPEGDDSIKRRTMAESIKELPFDLDTESGDFRMAAQNSYAAGDFRKAMIYLFSHVLVVLDQKGHIRLRRGKTNRQYLRELRAFRPLANFYQRVMVPFEAAFFGDHELERQDFESCWNELDEFQANVNQTSQVTHG